MTRIAEEYKDRLAFDALSGGMIFDEEPRHIGAMAGYIGEAYKNVEDLRREVWGRLPMAH
jgi:putative protein-disulfide isomerase